MHLTGREQKLNYSSFYDVFSEIQDNTENYIDYLEWEEFNYVVRKKTFAEIYRDIIQCYGNLRYLGVSSEHVVGLDIENTYEYLICDAALLLIGAQTVISNNAETVDLLKQRLDDFKAEFVVTKREILGCSQNVIKISSLLVAGNTELEIEKRVFESKDISIMFSSGTTGIPKALGITEMGSIWSANNFFNYMQFEVDDKFLIFMPLSNYQQRFLFWGCLMNKVNISLANDMTLFHSLEKLEPSILLAPPNFYYNLYCEQLKENNKNTQLIRKTLGSKMSYLLTGMAPIDNHVLEFYRDCNLEIYQIYGQTEIGMIACNTKRQNKLGSVGKPIIKLYISENKEVVTHSPYPIVSGYYEQNNFRALDNIRPTGDLGELDADGFVYIKGRMNDTIILNNGKKINPTMIENEIKNRYRTKEVVLYKTQSDTDEMILNAAVFIEDGITTDLAELTAFVMNLHEIKACTDEVRIFTYNMSANDKSLFYTENGKFSRAKAIKYLTEKQ